MLRRAGSTEFCSMHAWCSIWHGCEGLSFGGSHWELWKCSTQSGQMLKFTFRKAFVTADTHCSDGVFLSSFGADELLDGNQTVTSLCMSCAAGSQFDPDFSRRLMCSLAVYLAVSVYSCETGLEIR